MFDSESTWFSQQYRVLICNINTPLQSHCSHVTTLQFWRKFIEISICSQWCVMFFFEKVWPFICCKPAKYRYLLHKLTDTRLPSSAVVNVWFIDPRNSRVAPSLDSSKSSTLITYLSLTSNVRFRMSLKYVACIWFHESTV